MSIIKTEKVWIRCSFDFGFLCVNLESRSQAEVHLTWSSCILTQAVEYEGTLPVVCCSWPRHHSSRTKTHTEAALNGNETPTKAAQQTPEPRSRLSTAHTTAQHGTLTGTLRRRDRIQQTWCIVPEGERTWAWASCGSCWTCGPASSGSGWGRGGRPPMTSRWWAASPWCSAAGLGSPWSGCRRAPAWEGHARFPPAWARETPSVPQKELQSLSLVLKTQNKHLYSPKLNAKDVSASTSEI